MHYLYILHSKTANKFYVGETYELKNRINSHNNHYYQNAFTKVADDWEYVLTFECQAEADAVYLERFIKRMKSKTFIQKIIQNPEILTEILSKK